MPEKTWTASGCAAKLPEGVTATLQEDSSTPEKINLSVDEERRRLQEEQQQLREDVRHKENELKALEDESIATLNDASTLIDVVDSKGWGQ